MLDLTFGEQVKIILSRKGMTIKELAETIEKRTGKKMSRQNLTQRLGRDNFQEQDMRMIADILGCPFRLSILADSGEMEKASAIPDIEPTEKELNKITRSKEKKAKKEVKVSKTNESERDMTIGELMDIHKELDELMMETGKLPVIPDTPQSDEAAGEPEESSLKEPEVKEPETEKPEDENTSDSDMGQKEEPDDRERAGKKARGWRAYLQRITRKDEEEKKLEDKDAGEEAGSGITELHAAQEKEEQGFLDEEEDDYIDYGDSVYPEIDEQYEEEVTDSEEEEEVTGGGSEDYEDGIYDDEDLEVGEVNPRTGHEYETNSVRMHPKRIGYVQVYDRSDHRWTDMTEWAFLGYQERKKALLGKDYEPPIYLD